MAIKLPVGNVDGKGVPGIFLFDADGVCLACCLSQVVSAEVAALIAERDRLREVVAMFFDRVSRHGDWDDGCFYYKGTSAPELQEPLRRARAALGEGK